MLVPPYLGKSCGTGWHQIIGQLAIMRDSLTCSYSILTYIITTVLTGGAYPKCKLHFFNFSRCFWGLEHVTLHFEAMQKIPSPQRARYLWDVQRPILVWPPKGALKGWLSYIYMYECRGWPSRPWKNWRKYDRPNYLCLNIDPTIFRGLEDAFPLTLGYFRVYESISIVRGW
jgi:hypothetical protein